MRISSWVLAAALVACMAAVAHAGTGASYASTQAAFEGGLSAYKTGNYEMAIPALEEAATKGPESSRFFAEFYLARIYSDNAGPQTDHAKAYMLFQKLADEHADADPDDGQRAPFVAKALTALAAYLRNGVEEIGVRPNLERAADYLHHAATFFGDKDAQFELAKIYLSGSDGEDAKRGMHFLSTLTGEGYAGAQAFLADLFWRGRFVKKDEQRALALVTVAMENAPAHERRWIEDTYVRIFCGASLGVRKQADGVVAMWRQSAAPSGSAAAASTSTQPATTRRTCRDGEAVTVQGAPVVAGGAASQPTGALATVPGSGRPETMHSGALGVGLREK